eukprot:5893359-Pyramimonas_sp.AAC.1
MPTQGRFRGVRPIPPPCLGCGHAASWMFAGISCGPSREALGSMFDVSQTFDAHEASWMFARISCGSFRRNLGGMPD